MLLLVQVVKFPLFFIANNPCTQGRYNASTVINLTRLVQDFLIVMAMGAGNPQHIVHWRWHKSWKSGPFITATALMFIWSVTYHCCEHSQSRLKSWSFCTIFIVYVFLGAWHFNNNVQYIYYECMLMCSLFISVQSSHALTRDNHN